MNTVTAMMLGAANRGMEQKVFDWDQAARIISTTDNLRYAEAGLRQDFENTCGCIYEEEKPVKDSIGMYLASTWATPILTLWLDTQEDPIEIACYVMKSKTDWDANTKWPQSALDILNSHENHSV